MIFQSQLLIYVFRILKTSKSKEIPKKACVQGGVLATFEFLSWHDDEKENILLFYFEIKRKKLQDSCSLAYIFHMKI